MTTKKLNVEEMRRIQKELYDLGVLEEYTDYKISEKYLNDFLKNYSKLYGQYIVAQLKN